MGAIEDTRKVLQDFLAPELRAISARLDALEKRVDSFEKSVEKHFGEVGKRFDDAERRADRRHDEMLMIMRQVLDVTAIQQRLAKLESQQLAHQ